MTNFQNPQEVDSFIFEGKYSSSEAGWDQQAVSYFPESETLAIPFRSDGTTGLRVFDVDSKEGFTSKGDIIHEGGTIRRSLRIGNDLYAISNKLVTVHDLDTLEKISEVTLSDSSNPFYPVITLDPVLIGGIDTLNVTPTTEVEPIISVENNTITENISLGSGDNFGSVSITRTDDMVSVSASASSGIPEGNELSDFATISTIKSFS